MHLTERPAGTDPVWRPLASGSLRDSVLEAVEAIAVDLTRWLTALPELEPTDPTAGRRISLGGGLGAVALFFAERAAMTGDQRDADMVEAALARAIDDVSRVPMPHGLFGGLAGIGWLITHLADADVTGNACELGVPDDAVLAVLATRPWQERYDLISGLTGLGAYGLGRARAPAGRMIVSRVVEHLANLALRDGDGIYWHTPQRHHPPHRHSQFPHGWNDLGLAHGASGVIAFLAEATRIDSARATASALLPSAVSWLRAQRLPDGAAGFYSSAVAPDAASAPRGSRLAWCYGDLSVASGLFAAARACEVKEWRDDAHALLRAAAQRPPRASGVVDASFCHGAAGIAHIFNRSYQASGDVVLANAATRWLKIALNMRQQSGGIGGYVYREGARSQPLWRAEVGLLEGGAGIGLALMATLASCEPRWDAPLMLSGISA